MINWHNVKDEVKQILQRLLRINTTNPPGNETEAARSLVSIAQHDGLTAQIIEVEKGRGNFYLKCPGAKEMPPLILLSHLDVVAADPAGWRYDPFAGFEKDGWLWGRGALDAKHLTTMHLMVCLLLARLEVTPQRDIVMLATADEEQGGGAGLARLVKTMPQLFKEATVISEGGGFPLVGGHAPLYLCETGQKGYCRLSFNFKRPPGETPYLPANREYMAAVELIKRIEVFRWPGEIPDTTAYLIKTMAQIGLPETARLSPLLGAMQTNSLVVTRWDQRGSKDGTGLIVDCRLLPGVEKLAVEEAIKELVCGLEVEWSLCDFTKGFESGYRGELYPVFRQCLTDVLPGSRLAPFIATAGSDARHLQGLAAKVYGFSPVLPELPFEQVVQMVHGLDERISVDSLLFGTRVLFNSVFEYVKG